VTIVHLPRVDSTQGTIFDLAAQGAADRTVVVADYQAAGRGRRGRAWDAPAGTSLLTSVLVRPRSAPGCWGGYSLVSALAVADALSQVAGLGARLKWPNDVLVGGRKIAGILLESRMPAAMSGTGPAGTVGVIAVGIGINLRQRAFPAGLAARATSVWLETGHDVDRDGVLAATLDAFDRWRAQLEHEGLAPIRARWLALADTIGQRVSVEGITGVAVDLDADGALVLQDGEHRHRVVAGEVGVV
jgi:BirA family transcriptional regulator, biotin operon repressor / biotin---[acetyl-CoA-carboxylase] ligase